MSLQTPRRIFTNEPSGKSLFMRYLLRLTLVCLLVAGLWTAGLFKFVDTVRNQKTLEARQKPDAIVVLTGGGNRLAEGFELLEQGKAGKLFISGVYRGIEVTELMQLWREFPDKQLECCVVLGYEAGNTSGNAAETQAWLEQEGFRSFYLVTANYHIQRALLEFQPMAENYTIIPWPVSPARLDLNSWWRHPLTKRTLVLEYNKLIYSHIRNFLLNT